MERAIQIRDACRADLPFLRAGLAALNDEMQVLAKQSGHEAEGFSGERHLQSDRFLIAERAGSPCGYVSIWIQNWQPEAQLVAPHQRAAINTLYVEPDARRQGIALALLKEAADRCRHAGAGGIGLGYLDGNGAAEAVYRRAGYAPTRHAMWLDLGVPSQRP